MSSKEREAWLKAVGQAIRGFRTRSEISQEALGALAGLHRTYVSDVERGRRNPTVWTLHRLAHTLSTTSSEILHDAERILGEE